MSAAAECWSTNKPSYQVDIANHNFQILDILRVKLRRFKVYVAYWVAEISEYIDVKNWQHMHGRQNTVEACTRGVVDPAKLLDRDKYGTLWLHGPEFL